MSLLQATAQNSDSQLESLNHLNIKPFLERLQESGVLPLKSKETIQTMQMNVGKICNLSCKHCHVEAGPLRRESMSQAVMAQGLQVMADHGIKTLDITGGAPELNPNFPWLIQEAKKLNRQVMTRTNLTVLDDGILRGASGGSCFLPALLYREGCRPHEGERGFPVLDQTAEKVQ